MLLTQSVFRGSNNVIPLGMAILGTLKQNDSEQTFSFAIDEISKTDFTITLCAYY